GDGKRLGRVDGADHLVAEALELHRHEFADLAVVLDAKNGFVSAQHWPLVALNKRNCAGISFWQVDPERRAAAFLAENFDAAAGLLEEAEHHAQSKPGALAHFLCRKERIKDLVADRWRDARPGIADVDDDIIAGALDADGHGFTDAEHRVARGKR